MNLFDIEGKTALITGASKGIGKAVAEGFLNAGVNVAAIGRNFEEDFDFHHEKSSYKRYYFDLENFDDYDNLLEHIIEDFGTIDILVNNAGVQKRHPSVEFPQKDWQYVMDINCSSVFLMCQKVGKIMLEKGCGKIINMASLLAFQGGYTVPAYAASKSAVMGFTKSLSNEWAQYGININCIAPGYMETDMNTALINDETRSRQILERIPAKRWGRPEDIAGTCLFLASNASDYVNGFTIAVDGGWLGR